MPDTVFSRVKLGGGGHTCHIDISPDGATRLVKTDVFGAYIWANPSDRADIDTTGMAVTHEWCQLLTRDNMPSDEDNVAWAGGHAGYEIGSAPSNPDRIYGVFIGNDGEEAFYVSDDRAATAWTRRAMPAGDYNVKDSGADYRLMWRKMAVDPVDEDSVYVIDNTGALHYTRNAGVSWSTVSTSELAIGTPGCIAIDPSSSTVSGRKSRLYAKTGVNAVHVSDDSGVTWTATTSGPTGETGEGALCMICDSIGRVWVTIGSKDESQDTQNCWRYVTGTWTNLTPDFGDGFWSVLPNPFDTDEIFIQYRSADLIYSDDGGDTFTAVNEGAVPARLVTDIPWLAVSFDDFLATGFSCFDPVTEGLVWNATGIGVFYTEDPPTISAHPVWTELSRGNEELIVERVVKPPGGFLLATCQDRAVFRFDDLDEYRTKHGPFMDVAIRHGWYVDYAKNDSDFVVCLANGGAADRSAYSTDGGDTWTEFAGKPASVASFGGAIAVSTPTNMCWFNANNGRPTYTTDGGASWTYCTFPEDVVTTGVLGWANSLLDRRVPVWADKVTTGTFYAYNYGADGGVDAEGFYRSTDGGANWTKRGAGAGVLGVQAGAGGECVPGEAGHFFWAAGIVGGIADTLHPYDSTAFYKTLIFSDDGGTNAYKVADWTEAWDVGFGMAAPGHDYPSIFVGGQRIGDTDPGIYRCDDWDSSTRSGTWTRLGENYGTIDCITSITGDMDEYGTLYFGTSGGVYMGSFAGETYNSAGLRFRWHT